MTYCLLNKDHQITWLWQFGDGDFFFSHPCCRMILHFFLFFFSLVFSRWEQHWTLTCWNMMRTPSQLFYVWTASELEDYWVKKKLYSLWMHCFVHFSWCIFFPSVGVWWSCGAPWRCLAATRISPVPSECCRSVVYILNAERETLCVWFLRNAVDALICLTLKTKLSHVLHPLKQIQ